MYTYKCIINASYIKIKENIPSQSGIATALVGNIKNLCIHVYLDSTWHLLISSNYETFKIKKFEKVNNLNQTELIPYLKTFIVIQNAPENGRSPCSAVNY